MHQFGGSKLFLIGILLYTLGNLVSTVATLSPYTVINVILIALPVIAFWMIYAASKSPKIPEKTLSALTMFKVVVVIGLVVLCLVVFVFLIAAIAMMIGANSAGRMGMGFDGMGFMIVGIVFMAVTVIMLAIIIIYYKAILGILRDIRIGIMTNNPVPLRGVGVLKFFVYVGAAFTLLGSFAMLGSAGIVDRYLNDMIYSMPYEYWDIFGVFTNAITANASLSAITSIITSAGTVICVVVLGKFNSNLKYGR